MLYSPPIKLCRLVVLCLAQEQHFVFLHPWNVLVGGLINDLWKNNCIPIAHKHAAIHKYASNKTRQGGIESLPETIAKSNLAFWECSLPMGFTYHRKKWAKVAKVIMNHKPDVNLKAQQGESSYALLKCLLEGSYTY